MQKTDPRGRKRHESLNERELCLPRSLAVAAHDLDLVRGDCRLVVQFERDILDEECPDFVTESVGIQVALFQEKGGVSFSDLLTQQTKSSPFGCRMVHCGTK